MELMNVPRALQGRIAHICTYKQPLKSRPTPSQRIQGDKQRLEFVVPSRGMIGFKTTFVHLTRGEGLMARSFLRYDSYRGPLQGVRKGEGVRGFGGSKGLMARSFLQYDSYRSPLQGVLKGEGLRVEGFAEVELLYAFGIL